ncbi:MAG: DUF5343 domain-containing protein [bacterium]|nr:DUF5343 domain-containing protein [bacterium]
MEWTYLQNPNGLKRFLDHIQRTGVPTAKVDGTYLKGAGFKDNNDIRIITVLKFLGLLDGEGKATELWQQYRNKEQAPALLGTILQKKYGRLFEMYPDAQNKDTEALRNYFTSKTKLGEKAVALTVSTFKALCEKARFDSRSSGAHAPTPEALTSAPHLQPAFQQQRVVLPAASSPTVQINIELQIPATSEADIYDKFFAAMRKHLFQAPNE